jgi:hypothetical protein
MVDLRPPVSWDTAEFQDLKGKTSVGRSILPSQETWVILSSGCACDCGDAERVLQAARERKAASIVVLPPYISPGKEWLSTVRDDGRLLSGPVEQIRRSLQVRQLPAVLVFGPDKRFMRTFTATAALASKDN